MFKLITLFLLLNFHAEASKCIKTRAAFDIGSGTTKMKVARVNFCTQKIIKILHESDRAVGYKQDLRESPDNKLSSKITKRGISKLNELKKEASLFKPQSYTAVATSAFRTAKNGKEVATLISRETDIKINIISQIMEAKLGFIGGMQYSSKSPKNTIVWDIGGGSMQITSYIGDEKYDIYQGKIASVSFKNQVIEKIKNKNPKKVKSPNPLTRDDFSKALSIAQKIASQKVQKSILSKINKDFEIVGVGGVHYYAILKALNKKSSYNQKDLTNYLNNNLNKSDEQLGNGKYVKTSLTSLVLVLGFMKAMKIASVKVGKVNLADALLLKPSIIR